ncbi:MAG: hypothetical protein IJB64_01830 [Akkermansia sp.]|nr:hypothetical protein [Akkermansia sp.]
MKLHLPVTLLRAVMALFATTITFTSAWAQDAAPADVTYSVNSDVTYGSGEGKTPWAGEIPEWTWDYENEEYVLADGKNVTFTSPQDKTYTVVFDGTGGAFVGENENSEYSAVVGCDVTFEKLNEIKFTGFEGNSYAVYSEALKLQNNNKVSVIGNTSPTNIYSGGITLSDNGVVEMSQNVVESKATYFENGEIDDYGDSLQGGVIYAFSRNGGDASFVDVLRNKDVKFSNNKVVSEAYEAYGSVIYSEDTVALEENTKVAFVGNSAESRYVDKSELNGYNPSRYHADAAGGAIYSSYWTDDEEPGIGVSIVKNGEVEFSNNTVVAGRVASGGAIHNEGSETQLSGNDSITFSQNKAESRRDGGVKGGAIYSREKLTLTGNGNILFDGNTISTVGGFAIGAAIAVGNDIDDTNGGVFIDGNTGTITVSNNGVTTYGKYYGKDGNQYISGALSAGAIVSMTTISISGNAGIITFSGNYINDIAGTADEPFDFNGSSSSSSSALIAGAAIASAGAVVVNENKSDILFTGNILASQCSSVFGGAMVNVMGGIAFLSNEGKIEFTGNSALTTTYGYAWGGAVSTCATLAGTIVPGITVQSSVVFDGNGDISFSGNKVSAQMGPAAGGAIYSSNDVILTNNGDVAFGGSLQGEGNTAQGYHANGGAIYSEGNVAIGGVNESGESQGNGDVSFVGNSAIGVGSSGYGGAIYARDAVTIMGNSGNITFNDNKAIATKSNAYGGAIYSGDSVSIKENTGDITFNNNVIESCYWAEGAAIYADEIVEIVGIGYADGKTPGDVTFKENSISVSDSGGRGAAIYGEHGVNLSHNGNILFEGNWVYTEDGSARGAGISTCTSEPETQEVVVSILSNGNVTFNNNDTSAFHESSHGGAIHSYWGAVDISGNKDVTFTNNDIVSRDNSESGGGAIYSEFGASIVGNGNVTISSNTASSQGGNVYGGAINTDRGSIVINENKAITISNNRVTAVGSFMKEVVEVDAEGNEVIVGTKRADSQITAGGALASNKNVEISSNNGDIIFSQNSVTETKVDEVLPSDGWDGSGENPQLPHMAGSGAIGAGESLIMIGNDGNISFSENSVSSECKGVYGGAIATIGGYVNISNNTVGIESAGTLTVDGGDSLQLGAVNFSQNKATATGGNCSAHGGAIATFTDYYGGGQVFITGNDTVTFYYNSATSKEGAAYGGAIYAANVVDLSGNGDVAFVGNKAEAYDSDGGAIFSQKGVSITNNGAVTFSGNVSYANGGAIHVGSYESTPNAYVNISNNTGLVSFVDNKVTSDTICVHGAAINSFGNTASVTLSGNTAGIQFIGNMGSAEQNSSVIGGGIFCQGEIKFTGNGDILFQDNSVSSMGGDAFGSAMCNSVGNIILDNNLGSVQFIGNKTSTLGGFYDQEEVWNTAGTVSGAVTTSDAVSISGNKGAVVFKGNTVEETTTDELLPSDGYPGNSMYPITSGGAVSAALGINVDNNQSVNISGNSVLSETRSALGGALATFGGVSISHNKGDVNVSGNYAASKTGMAMGGAIYAENGLSIVNNEGNVTFSGNYVKNGDTHQLNSVVVQGGKVELAAVEGKSISFYDSVLVGAGSEMVLNSYTDASGQKQTSSGAVVFSGANAVETLQQLKGEGGTVSAGEISASLTSQINREVSVAGGSLQVKDGAVLRMQSLIVNNGAELLIGADSTVAVGSTVTFKAGSEYTVLGLKAATTMTLGEVASSTPTAQIAGDIVLTAGMTYTMDGAYTELVGSANELAFKGSGTYTFNVDESVAYTEGTTKYFVLFTGVDTLTGAELSTGVDPTLLSGIEFLTNIGYYDDIMLHYLNHETAGGVLYISATVPEPTTATLSLLALAALAARRRRK